LLPSEKENRTGKPGHFKTLATFRNDEEFCLKDALEQYHENPIPYANALAEVGKEICEVTYQKDSTEYRALRAKDRVRRQRYYHMIEGVDGTFTFMSLREWFMPWQAVRLFDTPNQIFRDYVNAIGMNILGFVGLIDALETTNTLNSVRWIEEFEKFRKNVNRLCRDIGCEVEDFPTLQETIQRLKRYASEGTQKMSPLWEENARLKRKLEAQKRIIAAVQIRCTIENLVHAIPNKGKYDDRAAGNKWKTLWSDIQDDVKINDQSPFCALLKGATGHRADDIIKAGVNLYSAMSAEIHGYEGLDASYEHFDIPTNKISRSLLPCPHRASKDIDWKEEIKKYPHKLEGNPACSNKSSKKSREEPSKEWIESLGFCEECISKIRKKVSGKSGPIADTEEESSTDWADRLGEEDDPGDEILES
jgi:hypothetical protein